MKARRKYHICQHWSYRHLSDATWLVLQVWDLNSSPQECTIGTGHHWAISLAFYCRALLPGIYGNIFWDLALLVPPGSVSCWENSPHISSIEQWHLLGSISDFLTKYTRFASLLQHSEISSELVSELIWSPNSFLNTQNHSRKFEMFTSHFRRNHDLMCIVGLVMIPS